MDKPMLDILWLIVASGLVFLMQAGFAMVESGLTRSKNSINVAIKNLTDLGVSVLVFWALGFALMFGNSVSGLFGGSGFLFKPGSTWQYVFFLFQAMFCSTSATIVSGAVAERMKYSSYIVSTVLLAVCIYPLFGHWVWGGLMEGQTSGWLGRLGFVDFAGSTVVHSLGGWVSLALLLILGPRTGRFSKDGKANAVPGSNIPMVVLGVLLLWFGWFGFNGGSTLAMNGDVAPIIVKTTLAAAAGMIASLILGWSVLKRPEVSLVLNGALAGLVAITAGCHAVSEVGALLIGAVGGIVMFGSQWLLEKMKIDDAVGAIPVHLAAGIWGTLAVALFGNLSVLGTELSRLQFLGVQALGVASCGVWAMGIAFPVLWIMNRIRPLRVSAEAEKEGLNKAEHGVTTEIFELYAVLEEQSRSGDLSLRAPEEPFTEVGQIARMYNTAMAHLEENVVAKDDYLRILDNVSDGLFLLDKDGCIGPHYSAMLETLFRKKNLAGMPLVELVNQHLSEDDIETLGEFLELAFDPEMDWETVLRFNPLRETSFRFDNGRGGFAEKHYIFVFQRIGDAKNPEKLLVLVRDVSAEKDLEKEMDAAREKSRSEMELLYKLIHVDSGVLRDFLDSFQADCRFVNQALESRSGNYRNLLNEIFQHIHSIKGDADMLGLDFITDQASKLEDIITDLQKKEDLSPEDFLPLTLSFGSLRESSENIESLLGRFRSLALLPQSAQVENALYLHQSLQRLIERLQRRHEKIVRLEMDAECGALIPDSLKKDVRDVLVQMTRNAVYHGIEEEEERRRNGKPPEGCLQVDISRNENSLILTFRDDGRGLDAKVLQEKAGLEKLPDAKELSRLIFSSGFSTAEETGLSAGRGVGLSLVRDRVKNRGGQLKLKSRPGQYCEFRLTLPLESA